MQKLQDSVFSIVKTTNLASSVFSYLQPTEEISDKSPQGGILNDTKHGWLALGTKFCVIDLRTGLKVAAKTFGPLCISITCVVELPTPLTINSQQLIISLECEDNTGLICVFHINGSQTLRCIQTDTVVTQLSVCDGVPVGPLASFDGTVIAGSKHGEIFLFDLNRAFLIQALKDISEGYEDLVKGDNNTASLTFLPLQALDQIEQQRDLVIENNDHIALLLNENSLIDGQYIFRNPDGTVRMKAKKDHIRVTVLQYIPQLASLAVGFNFGAFQIWNLVNVDLEFTSQVNVECLPVTQFGFQEPCDDPRAFCYLWVIFSVLDRLEEEEFPLAVMYSLTYLGKRMLSDTNCLYQEFSTATIRFQLELSPLEDAKHFIGGKCISCHTYSVDSSMAADGEESFLNLCQMVWECWGDNPKSPPCYGMILFDLDQWYKDQMPATYNLETNAFMSTTWCSQLSIGSYTLDIRIATGTISPYCHATRQDPHLCPNSLSYECICLNTSEVISLQTTGLQRHLISCLENVGPTALLNPTGLFLSCVAAGLTPQASDVLDTTCRQEEQRKYLLSVALEARLTRFLKRCAHDWATGTHSSAGCTLDFLVDWCWQRAVELKRYAKELSTPLFVSSSLPDRNVVRCLEHCVQQLTQLTGLLDAVLTKCCNLIVPTALSEIEEKYKGIGTVSLYFQVVQWFLRVGLLPERRDARMALPYPATQLYDIYTKRRLKLQRLHEQSSAIDLPQSDSKSCPLLYIDQLMEHEFGGDRIHQMWIRGGSECDGLYPPPSLYSLLRLYLMPDISEEHKHSLVLYLLIDYSMVYEDVRYESVIRRLMQFPTMFGLSNTAIKATQAFWHLDHRDFDFALDQLQCLTGNTLNDWQHHVVLSSLLIQKKTQAALQYLHVRKPPPLHTVANSENLNSPNVNDHDKLDDWQACSNLYLARGLVYEALDVVRVRVSNYSMIEDKMEALEYFFKCCKNTGHLSKLLEVVLSPFEEELFIKYLQNCNEPQTSDILVMFYLQQARYIEADQYNKKIKQSRPTRKDLTSSNESLFEGLDRDHARDLIVESYCSALPPIARSVAKLVTSEKYFEPHILAPKPMSVFIQANSPKSKFTYKSSFIQDTIESASETWINKPKMRKGLKRALNIEQTPFICTPTSNRKKSIFTDQVSESTPPKRARLDLTNTPKTPKVRPCDNMSEQMKTLLDMPEVQSPDCKAYLERSGTATPQSILKVRRYGEYDHESSPVDSRYLGNSDDELETASNHTHCSDSKHLRFTIPSIPGLDTPHSISEGTKHESVIKMAYSNKRESDMDVSIDSYVTTASHPMSESHLESQPNKLAIEETIKSRKSYKDSVRGRRSLSISANSSLSEDPNTSIESIADIPITLINPKYSGERRRSQDKATEVPLTYVGERPTESTLVMRDADERARHYDSIAQRTPQCRRSIRSIGESTPLQRSRSVTPDRQDSPVVTPMRSSRMTRSRSRTPDISPRVSPLAPILEQPKQEIESEPHGSKTLFSATRRLRSRSHTPDRIDKIKDSPKLEVISESPVKSTDTESPSASPKTRSLRSRSRTPDVEITEEVSAVPMSPRSLRSRTKTPEKIMTPKFEHSTKVKKPLSRMVLEANTFSKTKQIAKEATEDSKKELECTPMKTLQQTPSLMDVTISPIVNKTILHSSVESVSEDKEMKPSDENVSLKSLPAFTINETGFEKSVLQSYESSVADTSESNQEETQNTNAVNDSITDLNVKSLPAFTTINVTDFDKSVLHSYQSSIAESSSSIREEVTETGLKITKEMETKSFSLFRSFHDSDIHKSVLGSCNTTAADTSEDKSKHFDKNMSSLMTSDSEMEVPEEKNDKEDTASNIQKEKEKIVEIEREINEIEGDMSNESAGSTDEEVLVDDESDEGEGNIDEEREEADEGDNGEDAEDSEENDDDDENEIVVEALDNQEVEDSEESEGAEEVVEDAAHKDSDGSEVSVGSQDDEGNDDVEESEDDEECEDDVESVDSEESNNAEEKMELEKDKISNLGQKSSVPKANVDEVITVNDSDSNSKSLQIDDNSTERPTTGETNNTEVVHSMKVVDIVMGDSNDAEMSNEPSVDPLNQGQISILTDDNSIMESDHSDIKLNYSDEEQGKDNMETESNATETECKVTSQIEKPPYNFLQKNVGTSQENMEVENYEEQKEPLSANQETADKDKIDVVKEDKAIMSAPLQEEKETETVSICEENKIENIGAPASKTRKRVNSMKETQSELLFETTEPKTPMTRKRSQSFTLKLNEDTTPEESKESDTPSKRRGRTPTSSTSSEVRRILTRRVSKELSEKSDDSKSTHDESTATTPSRRSSRSKKTDDTSSVVSNSSTRVSHEQSEKSEETKSSVDESTGTTPSRRSSRSKKTADDAISVASDSTRVSQEQSEKTEDTQSTLEESTATTPSRRSNRSKKTTDDAVSVASDSSVRSSKSKASEDSDRPASIRKGRRSILVTKPDLSVIPESTTEEQSKEDLVNDLTSSRRLTRHQKAVITSWLDPQPSPQRRLSKSQAVEEDMETFEGWPENDAKESPESETSQQLRNTSRAASESRSTPKAAAKIGRRVSVGVLQTPEAVESPSRGRRASFTRAIEALHTPKGRRTSTDLKKSETDSSRSSPVPEEVATPSRRGRKASTQKSETDSIRGSPVPEESAIPSRRGRKASTQKTETDSVRSSPVPEEKATPSRRTRRASVQAQKSETSPEEQSTPSRRGRRASSQSKSEKSSEVKKG